MEQFESKNILNFIKQLPKNYKCKEYLAKYKWQNGFKYHCYLIESSTSNPLFHKVKFDLHKVFCIIFEITTSSKMLLSKKLGGCYSVSQTSTWFFMGV